MPTPIADVTSRVVNVQQRHTVLFIFQPFVPFETCIFSISTQSFDTLGILEVVTTSPPKPREFPLILYILYLKKNPLSIFFQVEKSRYMRELFISHSWKPLQNRVCGHEYALHFSLNVKRHGWTTWIDDHYMYGYIDSCIANAINECKAFIVLLSSGYNDNFKNDKNSFYAYDNCFKELNYALHLNKPIILVVVDEKMKNMDNWASIFIIRMAGFIFLDATKRDVSSALTFTLQQYNIAPHVKIKPSLKEIFEKGRKKNSSIRQIIYI